MGPFPVVGSPSSDAGGARDTGFIELCLLNGRHGNPRKDEDRKDVVCSPRRGRQPARGGGGAW